MGQIHHRTCAIYCFCLQVTYVSSSNPHTDSISGEVVMLKNLIDFDG